MGSPYQYFCLRCVLNWISDVKHNQKMETPSNQRKMAHYFCFAWIAWRYVKMNGTIKWIREWRGIAFICSTLHTWWKQDYQITFSPSVLSFQDWVSCRLQQLFHPLCATKPKYLLHKTFKTEFLQGVILKHPAKRADYPSDQAIVTTFPYPLVNDFIFEMVIYHIDLRTHSNIITYYIVWLISILG